MRIVRAVIGVGLAAGMLALGACSQAGDGGGDAATAADGGEEPAAAGAGEGGSGVSASPPPVDLAATRTPEQAQAIISTAAIHLDTRAPEAAAARATAIVRDAGGHLFSQQAALGDEASVQVVYKVPPERFDAVLDAFGELGEVTSRTVDTEDVTGQVVDLEARLASTRTSVDRLRELLASSGGVSDLLAVEQALAQREAEAESLAAQLTALRARVDLATITLEIGQTAAAATAEVSDDIPGFLTGLRSGAAAFGNAVLVVVTVVGFVLPFLALAVVVGGPVWYVSRRRRPAAGT
jgi:hypothetical protein